MMVSNPLSNSRAGRTRWRRGWSLCAGLLLAVGLWPAGHAAELPAAFTTLPLTATNWVPAPQFGELTAPKPTPAEAIAYTRPEAIRTVRKPHARKHRRAGRSSMVVRRNVLVVRHNAGTAGTATKSAAARARSVAQTSFRPAQVVAALERAPVMPTSLDNSIDANDHLSVLIESTRGPYRADVLDDLAVIKAPAMAMLLARLGESPVHSDATQSERDPLVSASTRLTPAATTPAKTTPAKYAATPSDAAANAAVPNPAAPDAAASSQSQPVDAGPVTLLYTELLTSHPEILAARKAVEGAGFGRDAADAGYYPHASLSSTLGRDRYTDSTGDSTSINRHNVDLIVRQNLYTGGKLEAQNKIAAIDENLQKANLRAVTQRVLLDAMSAHLQAQRTSLLLTIAQSSERATADLAKLEERREKLGGAGFTDVSFARTRLSLAQERTRQAEVVADEASNTFRQVFAREADVASLPDLTAPLPLLPATLPDAIEQAVSRSPDMRAGEIQRDRATQSLALEKANSLPTAELVGTRRLTGESASAIGQVNDNTLGVRLNYSLYTAGELRARAGLAAAQVEVAEQSVRNVARRTEDNVRTLWSRTAGARARIDSLESAADDARKTFLSRARLREFGRETALAVLDSQLEYNNVLIGLVNATFDRRLNSIRLLGATGALGLDLSSPERMREFIDTESNSPALKRRIERMRLL